MNQSVHTTPTPKAERATSPIWRALLAALFGVGVGDLLFAAFRLNDWSARTATFQMGLFLVAVSAVGLLWLWLSARPRN